MRNTVTRILLGCALALVFAPAPAGAAIDVFAAPGPSSGIGSLSGTYDQVALAIQPGRAAGKIVTDEDFAPAAAPAQVAAEHAAPVETENNPHWVLGAIGAVCALGAGITFAGVYWSGPRCFARW